MIIYEFFVKLVANICGNGNKDYIDRIAYTIALMFDKLAGRYDCEIASHRDNSNLYASIVQRTLLTETDRFRSS